MKVNFYVLICHIDSTIVELNAQLWSRNLLKP